MPIITHAGQAGAYHYTARPTKLNHLSASAASAETVVPILHYMRRERSQRLEDSACFNLKSI